MTSPDNSNAVTVTSPRPLRAGDAMIVFAARDANGPLELCLTPALWERLQAEAPLPADDADRRDHALDRIEQLAATMRPPATSPERRMIFLG